MGLDMYLTAERYVSGWNHRREPLFDALAQAVGVSPCSESPSFTIKATIGYWRKANAIHAWFVKNVQDGKDDCRNVEVSRDQLAELRQLCQHVLDTIETVPGEVSTGTTYSGGRVEHHTRPGEVVAQTMLAEKLLPTQSGFFFGNTDYDEGYLDDLRRTVEIVNRALAMEEDWDFSYRSSW